MRHRRGHCGFELGLSRIARTYLLRLHRNVVLYFPRTSSSVAWVDEAGTVSLSQNQAIVVTPGEEMCVCLCPAGAAPHTGVKSCLRCLVVRLIR